MPPDSQRSLVGHSTEAPGVRLVVQRWHTECGACGYGRGGWGGSPALKDKPILTPESRECPECGAVFASVYDPYSGRLTVLPAVIQKDGPGA